MKGFRFWLLPVLLLAVLITVAAWISTRGRLAPARRPNVILISIDTCRADYLSCYGHPRNTTPNIDAVAEQGVLFSEVITPVPNTLPAHSSMFTGTIPPYHGVHHNIAYRLRESNVTLAEVLREHGYLTAGVLGAFVMHSQFGIAQGFDTYKDRIKPKGTVLTFGRERTAGEVTDLAATWL